MNDLRLRYAVKEDLPALLGVWALSFGDDEALVRQIFLESGILSTTVVCQREGHVCGMMAAFDGLCFEGKAASYLYALCTHPNYRGHGLGAALTRESAKLAFARGSELVCLHPASASLAAWYETLGFAPAAAPAYEEVWPSPANALTLTALSAEEYARCRKVFGAAELPQALLNIQALFCRESGGGLFRAEWNEQTALLCAEHRGGELMLREVLCEESVTAALAAAVSAQLGAQRAWRQGSWDHALISSPPQLMFLAGEHQTPPTGAHLPFLLD